MKKFLNVIFFVVFIVVILLTNAPRVFAEDKFIHGHKRSNGTIVESYYRTKANETVNDNYSTKGNVNPYTGKKGTVITYRKFRTFKNSSSS